MQQVCILLRVCVSVCLCVCVWGVYKKRPAALCHVCSGVDVQPHTPPTPLPTVYIRLRVRLRGSIDTFFTNGPRFRDPVTFAPTPPCVDWVTG